MLRDELSTFYRGVPSCASLGYHGTRGGLAENNPGSSVAGAGNRGVAFFGYEKGASHAKATFIGVVARTQFWGSGDAGGNVGRVSDDSAGGDVYAGRLHGDGGFVAGPGDDGGSEGRA